MTTRRYERKYTIERLIFTLSISLFNLSIGEPADTLSLVPCLFCRSLLPGKCPDDPMTLRIRETILMFRGANDASRVRVQLSSSRVINISSQAYSNRARLDSLTFRVELTRVEF